MTKNQQTLKTINYNYDALGRRVTRIVQTQNYAYTRKYMYDGNKILMELNQDNEPVAVYLHGPGIDNPIGMLRDHDGDGEFSENEIFIFTKDHLNSIRDLTNMNQRLVQRYNYSAYGKVKLERIADTSDVRFVENYFTYTSREWEPEVGFICHRARCQEGNGRWMSEDKKSFSGGLNLYNYVDNNPILMIDPNGDIGFLAGAAIALYLWGFPEEIGTHKYESDEYVKNLPAELRFEKDKTKKKIRKFEKDNKLLEGSCELG